MTFPTTATLRPVNPVLRGVFSGYINDPMNFIGTKVLPEIPTGGESTGTIMTAAAEAYFGDVDADLRRGPSGTPYEAHGVQMSSTTYRTQEYAIKTMVDDEQAKEAPLDLAAVKIRQAVETAKIKQELRIATLMNNTSTFTNTATLTGSDQWSAAGSDPFSDIATGMDAVGAYGPDPNVMVFGRLPWLTFRTNGTVLSFGSQDRDRNILSNSEAAEILAAKFGVKKVYVGKARYNTASVGQTAVLGDIWGDYVGLGHIPDSVTSAPVGGGDVAVDNIPAGRFVQTPWALDSYRDEDRKSTVYRVSHKESETAVSVLTWYIIADTAA